MVIVSVVEGAVLSGNDGFAVADLEKVVGRY